MAFLPSVKIKILIIYSFLSKSICRVINGFWTVIRIHVDKEFNKGERRVGLSSSIFLFPFR